MCVDAIAQAAQCTAPPPCIDLLGGIRNEVLQNLGRLLNLQDLFGVTSATITTVLTLSPDVKLDAFQGDLSHKDACVAILRQRMPSNTHAFRSQLSYLKGHLEKNASMAAFLVQGTDLQSWTSRGVNGIHDEGARRGPQNLGTHDLGTIFEALFHCAADQKAVAASYIDWMAVHNPAPPRAQQQPKPAPSRAKQKACCRKACCRLMLRVVLHRHASERLRGAAHRAVVTWWQRQQVDRSFASCSSMMARCFSSCW